MITLRVEGYQSDKVDEMASLISTHANYQGVIAARVISQEEVQALNSRYSREDKPTDVLSFSYIEDTRVHDGEDLGDIVISREHISLQARQAGTSEETEFLLLLMHGALHILGYDHADSKSQESMDAIQSHILEQLGLVYRNFGWRN